MKDTIEQSNWEHNALNVSNRNQHLLLCIPFEKIGKREVLCKDPLFKIAIL